MEVPDSSPAGDRGRLPSATAPMARTSPEEARPRHVGPLPGRITVTTGDSLSSIAHYYGVSTRSIIEANRLKPPYRLLAGQKLQLPRQREHVVQAGETMPAIAKRYGVDVHVLASANGLTQPYRLRTGQQLQLPAGDAASSVAASSPRGDAPAAAAARALPPAASAPIVAAPVPPVESATLPPPEASTVPYLPAPEPAERGTETPAEPPQEVAALPKMAPPPAEATEPAGDAPFAWPVRGKVISSYGQKGSGLHNDGINIAAERGAPVRAAAGGVVAYAGNELKAFGNLILIKHPGGWVSTYAHNEKLLVKRGDRVRRGQIIGHVGTSGSVSDPQLHFELRRGKRAVDPLAYLPPATA
jgi:murein DD-endopeptidase MepM/ murein hydrolase activator NlpD